MTDLMDAPSTDRLGEQFAEADRLLREAAERLDRLGDAHNRAASVLSGLTTVSRSTDDFVRAAAEATRALGQSMDVVRRTLDTSRSLFDNSRFDTVDERLVSVDSRLEELSGALLRQHDEMRSGLEARIGAYESVMTRWQRRRAEAKLQAAS